MHVDVYFERDACVLRRRANRDPLNAIDVATGLARAAVGLSVVSTPRGLMLKPYHGWLTIRDGLEAAGIVINSVCLVEDPKHAPLIDDTPF